jgi:hypothetical protein
MLSSVPQSTTLRVPLHAYLASDHATDATGLTLAVTISKNGAAFGNPSAGATNATSIGNGWYYVDLSATDTGTLGPLLVRGTAATADNVDVPPLLVVDATNGGWTHLDATITSRTKPADTQARVTLVDTLTTYTGNTPQTGDAFARLGAAGAGLTALGDTRLAHLDADVTSRTKPADTQARVTLVDTLTTYTGDTPQTGDVYPLVDTDVAAIKAKTDLIPATPLDAAGVRTAIGLASANLDTQLAEIEGETDGIAAIPTTPVTTAHFDTVVGTPVVSLAADLAELAGETDTLAAIKAKTDLIPASPAAVGSAMTLTAGERSAIALALMVLTSTAWEGTAPAKSLGTAVLKAVHKVLDNHGTLEIYRADGTTLHATQAETTDGTALPLVGLSGAS